MSRAVLLAATVVLAGGAGTPAAAPTSVTIATARGESSVPILVEQGHPVLAADALGRLLPVTVGLEGMWAEVSFARVPFRFLLGAPVFMHEGRLIPLAGGAYVARDSLFVPLEWLTDFVPRLFSEGYRYDPGTARFEEARLPRVTAPVVAGPRVHPPSAVARRNGFRMAHSVVIDPGHGGTDPGNPGRFLPRGVQEKHVNLAIGLLVRDELERRGVHAVMTRTTDTLINLRDRPRMCREECELFVSIHVNSMPSRSGSQNVSGVETYYLGDEPTEQANRVAAMENSALRYETAESIADTPIEFILKDLHTNEFLRESAQLADLVQDRVAAAHPGDDRGVAQHPDFAVLRGARRPAILVETGFATNRQDGRFLASDAGQERVARAIADGIVEYLRRYEHKVLPVGSQ